MRYEFIISAAVHTVVLVATAVALPSAEVFKNDEPPPVPVEIFTIDEFTQLSAKKTEIEPERNAPAVELEVKPEEPVPVIKPPKVVEPEAPPPPPKVAALEPPPPPIEVAPPETLPLAEPEPEPEPEPVAAPEPKPAPEPEPAKPEPKVVETPPPPPAATAPAPRKKPKPPEKVAKKKAPQKAKPKKPAFDPDKIAALLNKVQDDAGPSPVQTAGRVEDAANNVSGLDLVVTQSEMRYLQNQMQRCWNPPVGVANAASLNVKVEVRFNLNGQLQAAPVVLNSGGEGFDVAANAAVRAVQQCQPYDMPAEKYDNWQQVIVNFDPQFMLGG